MTSSLNSSNDGCKNDREIIDPGLSLAPRVSLDVSLLKSSKGVV